MTQVKIDMKGFKPIEKALQDKFKTRVGILGSNASAGRQGGATNASLGAIHEFGSVSGKIPARSFLKMPLELKIGEWIRKNRKMYFEMLTAGALKKFYVALGFAAESIIDSAFSSSGFGKWAPNLPRTVKQKGSSMPLIDTGQLKNSITSKVMSDE